MPLVILTDRELERFWSKVDKTDDLSCWNWTASKYHFGHGALYFRGRSQPAHRISWWIHHGEIPDGCEVCHYCDNPPCVNPGHLYVATHSQNVKDMHIRGRGVYFSGDNHWMRKHPEWIATGDRHPLRKRPELAARGELNGNSKLSNRSVRDIRLLYCRQDVTSTELASAYGLDKSTVLDVLNHKTWKHVQ